MKTAYLIGWMRFVDDAFKLVAVGICSEGPATITHELHKTVPVTILERCGNDYDNAVENLGRDLTWRLKSAPKDSVWVKIAALKDKAADDVEG